MEYACSCKFGKQTQRWNGTLRLFHSSGEGHELEVIGRGTRFHVIVGKHRHGRYICIPNHDVGCELSHLSDLFWNQERLSMHLRKVDAATVAHALCHLEEL